MTATLETTTILDGKTTSAAIREEVADRVRRLLDDGGRPPGLAAVLVGDDPASAIYVASKAKACRAAGIESREIRLGADTSQSSLLETVHGLNEDPAVDGILVQLPLPNHLDDREVIDVIDPGKDVDGFHPVNVGRLWIGEEGLRSATPAGIMELLRRYEIGLEGLHAVVVGRSNIVGKPLAGLLLASHCTVTVCHSRTRDLPAICRQADLLVASVGRPGMIGTDHVADGAVVIDVGINRLGSEPEVKAAFPDDDAKLERLAEKGSILVGDVDFDRVAPKCRAITPVPGGVGPLTIASLLVNTVRASEIRQGRASS